MGDQDDWDRDRKRKGKVPADEEDPNPYKSARPQRGGGDGGSSAAGASGAWSIPRAGAGNPGQDAPGSAPVVNLPHGQQQPGGSSFRDRHDIRFHAPASENLPPPTAPLQIRLPSQVAVQQQLQQYQAMQATNRRPTGQQRGGALGVGGSSFSFNHGHGRLQHQPRGGDARACPLCQNSLHHPCGPCLKERDPRLPLHPHQLAVQQLAKGFETMLGATQHRGPLGGRFGFKHGHGISPRQFYELRLLNLLIHSGGSPEQAPQHQPMHVHENARQLMFWLRRQERIDRLYIMGMRQQQLQNRRPVHHQPPQAPIPEFGRCPICGSEGEGRVSYHPRRHVCPCDACDFVYRCAVCQPEQAVVPATSGPLPPPPPPPVDAGAQQLQNQPAVGRLGEALGGGGYAAQLVPGPDPNDDFAPCSGCGLFLAPVKPQPRRHVCLCYACRNVDGITCCTCAGYDVL